MADGNDQDFVPYKPEDDQDFIPAAETSKAAVPGLPPSTIGPAQPRSLLQRAGDWLTSAPAYGGTLSSPGTSPLQKAKELGGGVIAGGGMALAAEPLADVTAASATAPIGEAIKNVALKNALRLGGATTVGGAAGPVGGWIGGPTGRKIAEVGGGLVGGLLGEKLGYPFLSRELGITLPQEMERLAAQRTAQKLAQRASDEEAGIRMPLGMKAHAEMEKDLAKRAATSPVATGAPGVTGQGTLLVPEPREAQPWESPGSQWSVKRTSRPDLMTRAMRGEPGSAQVLSQVQGKPTIIIPRGAGISGVRSVTEFPSEGVGSITEEPASTPSRTSSTTPPQQSITSYTRGAENPTYTGEERRASVRGITGVDPMRTARMSTLRSIIEDATAPERDRTIASQQLADMKANPFEGNELGNLESMKAPKPTLSREEAEANVETRKAGRNARFKGKP